MNKIIVFPGTISSNFFTNELAYIKKYFDIAAVIAYQEPYHKIKDIVSNNQLNVTQIKTKSIKAFFSRYFWEWLFCKDTIKEIKQNAKGKDSLKKFFYIVYYGCFCAQACQVLDKILDTLADDDAIYLYSYWLSRSAYAISYYYMTHRGDKRIKRVISRAHGYDLYVERNAVHYLPFRHTINNYLDSIHFISEDGSRYFKEHYSFSAEGAQKQVCHLGTYNRDSLVKQIYPKNEICIVSCSAIRKVKRLDCIVELISKLNDAVRWVHIGDGELSEEIKAYAKKKLSADRYTFIGTVSNDRILEQYKKYDADFFINLSDSEGIPVSIMEAMSYGLPCIGRSVGGMGEIIDEQTGLLLSDGIDYAAIVEQYIKIRLDNAEMYKEISEHCRTKWEAEYHAEKNYEAFFGGLNSE